MKFFLNKDTKPELILKANNDGIDLEDRWVLRNAGYFMKNEVGNSTSAFIKTKSGDKKLRRTSLALCEDTFMERTVLAKTVCYEDRDLTNVDAIKMRRRALAAQVDILNGICSNMLPEPLDFFFVTNDFDTFSCQDAGMFKRTEPVLILDYIPGDILADKLQSIRDKTFYRHEEGKTFKKSTDIINIGAVMRLVGDILAFEAELYEKGYAYTALSPDHIVLLGDNKPRFVGIGRICPVSLDRFDRNHINFGRHLKGYSAPEFNRKETGFGMESGVKAGIAYNLGVLIACIVLGKTEFDERLLNNGAYDYFNSLEDREAIKRVVRGQELDSLICGLTNADPSKRMTDFGQIMQELAVISGDAAKKNPIHYGTIKFIAHDKGFGYVTSDGEDYRVDLEKVDNIPFGWGNQSGREVAFTTGVNAQGRGYVKDFVTPPRTDVKFPKLVKKPEPVVQPVRPAPQPAPRPQPVPHPQPIPRPQPAPHPQPIPSPQPVPTPQPNKKKGLFDWLFGK